MGSVKNGGVHGAPIQLRLIHAGAWQAQRPEEPSSRSLSEADFKSQSGLAFSEAAG